MKVYNRGITLGSSVADLEVGAAGTNPPPPYILIDYVFCIPFQNA